MAIVFLQYSYVWTNAPISFCIPEGILSRNFTWFWRCVTKNGNWIRKMDINQRRRFNVSDRLLPASKSRPVRVAMIVSSRFHAELPSPLTGRGNLSTRQRGPVTGWHKRPADRIYCVTRVTHPPPSVQDEWASFASFVRPCFARWSNE